MHNHTLLLALEALPSPVPSPSTVHGLGDAGDKVEARGLHILSHMHTHTCMHGCVSNMVEASPTEPATPDVHYQRSLLSRLDTTQLESANTDTRPTPAATIHALLCISYRYL